MKTNKIKLSDAQVVERVLDYWDPMGAQDYYPGMLGEYDLYVPKALELLRAGASESSICDWLDEIRFKRMRNKSDENWKAQNRFYAWALRQTWKTQKNSSTNRLLTDNDQSTFEFRDRKFRTYTKYELIRQVLQDQDIRKSGWHWLCGADTLGEYDPYAIELCEAAKKNYDKDLVCLTLELLEAGDNDETCYYLENYIKSDGGSCELDYGGKGEDELQDEYITAIMSRAVIKQSSYADYIIRVLKIDKPYAQKRRFWE